MKEELRLFMILIFVISFSAQLVMAESILLGVSPDRKGRLEEINGQFVLHLSGSGYEMGYQHGYLMADEVKRTINAWVYDGENSTSDPPLKLQTVYAAMESYIPQRYKEEMQGLAQGAGVPLIDVQVAQIATDAKHLEGCEQIAVWDAATSDGLIYHGRNLGFPITIRDNSSGVAIQDQAVVIVTKPDSYNAFVNIGWPGITGSATGMNIAELSLAINAGYNCYTTPYGLARTFRLRKALEEAISIYETRNVLIQNMTVDWIGCLSDGKVPEAYAFEITGDSYYFGAWDDPTENKNGYWPIRDCVRRMNDWIYFDSTDPDSEYEAMSNYVEDNFGFINADSMEELLQNYTVHDEANLHSVVYCNSTHEFRVANAVGDVEAMHFLCKYYQYNLDTLMASTIPEKTDSIMPEVTIIHPTGGTTVSGMINILGTASDNIGISTVEVMVDDNGYTPAVGTTVWSKTIDTASWERGSWHRIKVRAIDKSGNGAIDIIGIQRSILFGVTERRHCVTRGFVLKNYPNPFNQTTEIRCLIPDVRSQTAQDRKQTSLRIYDLTGQLVKSLSIINTESPVIRIVWDGEDDLGESVPSGVYFLYVETGGFQKMLKLIKVR